MKEITLLSKEQIYDKNKQIDLIKYAGTEAPITDFAILLDGYLFEEENVSYDKSLKGRHGWWQTKTSDNGRVVSVGRDGSKFRTEAGKRSGGVRPVLKYDDSDNIDFSKSEKFKYLDEIEYGEYPQYAASESIQKELEERYKNKQLTRTGKVYITDSRKWNDYSIPFREKIHDEFVYCGKKYIRAEYQSSYSNKLSNGIKYNPGDIVWIEVSPIKWIVDKREKMLLSKKLIISGIRFCNNEKYNGDFEKTEMYKFLNNHFASDIVLRQAKGMTEEEKKEYEERQKQYLEIKKRVESRKNPYRFENDKVSEEEIINCAIESDLPVFLHGPSSEGKSARIKAIDPKCVTLYLSNTSPESLNGKSVYNSETGEMIDVKPSWLKKLETRCEEDPDNIHIVFFDEITNALPSIQGMAFNIILNKEVNGIWELPKNARIAAAGNEMSDSLSAHELSEPLYNRFVHVYIKTTTEGWLKWASDNDIHPAIYAYIAYKNGTTLRTPFTGEKPNADPRKWEMASKMLYKTNKPEALRGLIGEEVTKEFIAFCNNPVITLKDVLEKNYLEGEIDMLDTSERYSTALTLSQVKEENLDEVREFVEKLGKEVTAVFDGLWVHGDESRLERLQEAKLASETKGKKLVK